MTNHLACCAAATLLALSPGASAREIAAPDYAADWSMETADGKQVGKVYFSGGRERRELTDGGEKIVTIQRPDRKVVWTLMPGDKIYMENAPGMGRARKGDVGNYDIEQTPVGEETVNGVRDSKSKVILKEKKPNGSKLGGFMWTTREGIVVKMDVLSVEKGSKERIKSELSSLKLGKQDASLFEIPPGYERMSGMGALGAMFQGAANDDEDDANSDEKPAPKPKGDKSGFSVKGALERFK